MRTSEKAVRTVFTPALLEQICIYVKVEKRGTEDWIEEVKKTDQNVQLKPHRFGGQPSR